MNNKDQNSNKRFALFTWSSFGVMFRYFGYFFIASYVVVWSSDSPFGATFLSCQQSQKHVEEAYFGLRGSIGPYFV